MFSFLGSLSTMIGAAIFLGSFGAELKIFVQDLRSITQDKKNPDFFFPCWGHMDIIDLFSVFISCVCSALATPVTILSL